MPAAPGLIQSGVIDLRDFGISTRRGANRRPPLRFIAHISP
jgi:hypothetical protein